LRRAPSGDLLGYKLARPGDVTAAGEPVFYSGSKLAPDLSLPRLQQRWASTPSARTLGGAGQGPQVSEVLEAVAAARAALHAGGEDGVGISSATADLLTPSLPVTDVVGGRNGGERRRTGSTEPPEHPAGTRRIRVRRRDSCGCWPATCSTREAPPEAGAVGAAVVAALLGEETRCSMSTTAEAATRCRRENRQALRPRLRGVLKL
jgi:hypothetical protein